MAKTKNGGNGKRSGVSWGAGLAAAAAAAAIGAYFLYGKNGPKNRKMVKAWTLKAKGEILEQMEKLESVSEEGYHRIVDGVAARYSKIGGVDKADLRALVADAKKHWSAMKRRIGTVRRGSPQAKKGVSARKKKA